MPCLARSLRDQRQKAKRTKMAPNYFPLEFQLVFCLGRDKDIKVFQRDLIYHFTVFLFTTGRLGKFFGRFFAPIEICHLEKRHRKRYTFFLFGGKVCVCLPSHSYPCRSILSLVCITHSVMLNTEHCESARTYFTRPKHNICRIRNIYIITIHLHYLHFIR